MTWEGLMTFIALWTGLLIASATASFGWYIGRRLFVRLFGVEARPQVTINNFPAPETER